MNERLTSLVARLDALHIPYRVLDLGGPAVRTRDVIANKDLDVDPEEIVKTILFKSKRHGPFAVSVPGRFRIDYKKLKQHFTDKDVSTLRPEEMRALGWEPGECCPLNIPVPLLVDPSVFSRPRINTGSGDVHFGIEFPSAAITQLRDDVTVVDIRQE